MCSRPWAKSAVLLLFLAAAACGGGSTNQQLPASITSVDPACGDSAAETPVVVHGVMPVKVTSSLSGSGSSTADTTYRAWLGDTELTGVTWSGPDSLAAKVPVRLTPGDYPLTIETPFGTRVTKQAAFHVQVGACAPSAATLVATVEVSPNTVTVGQQVTARATVSNVGLSPALGVTGTIATPIASLHLVEQSAGPVDLAPGASTTFSWAYATTAQSPASGFTLDVDVAGHDAAGAPVTAGRARSNVFLVNAGAALSASAAAPARVSVGQGFTFSITVSNAGAAAALVTPDLQITTGVEPAPVAVVSKPGQRTVDAGGQQRFDFALRGAAAGDVSLTGTVSATDANSKLPIDVAPTAPVAVQVQQVPALTTTVSASPAVVASGGTVTVTAHVQNSGQATVDAVAATVGAAPPGFVAVPPLPDPQPIPGGAARDFVWTYRAGSGAGAGPFAVDAAGVDQNSRQPISAPRASSGTVAAAYHVGGSVSGLAGGELVLQVNGGNDLRIPSNGPFAFVPLLASGTSFSVTVLAQPTGPSQTCTLSGASGTVGTGDVTTVSVSCRADTFNIGGNVTGLAGSGLVLHESASNQDAGPAGNGSWAFPLAVPSGSGYAVAVTIQPSGPSQTCTVANGTGTVGGGPVTNVNVTCVTQTFTVGGTISGLTVSGLVLRNGAEDLPVAAGATSFTFATPVPSGGAYLVTVATSPAGEDCTVANGAGMVTTADVTSVAVTCTAIVPPP